MNQERILVGEDEPKIAELHQEEAGAVIRCDARRGRSRGSEGHVPGVRCPQKSVVSMRPAARLRGLSSRPEPQVGLGTRTKSVFE